MERKNMNPQQVDQLLQAASKKRVCGRSSCVRSWSPESMTKC